jgi:hypothetical protein
LDIKINVKRKFIINGREYNSVEEMPGDVRGIFEKAMSSQAGSGYQINPAATQTHIIFNGTTYESLESMPQDVRQLYEKALQAAETGAAQPGINISGVSLGSPGRPKTAVIALASDTRPPTKIQPSFSPRTLMVGLMLVALSLLLYYLFYGK